MRLFFFVCIISASLVASGPQAVLPVCEIRLVNGQYVVTWVDQEGRLAPPPSDSVDYSGMIHVEGAEDDDAVIDLTADDASARPPSPAESQRQPPPPAPRQPIPTITITPAPPRWRLPVPPPPPVPPHAVSDAARRAAIMRGLARFSGQHTRGSQ